MAALLHGLRYRQQGGQAAGVAERYAEVSAVQRLALHKELTGHDGCVNTACWSDDGQLLVSGSDDTKVVLWDWQPGRAVLQYASGHRNNVFQARVMPESGNRTVVSCGADGAVRVATIPEGTRGAAVETRKLAKHQGRAHKLALEPGSAHCFYSCGEDGEVRHYDLRQPAAGNRRLLVVHGCHAGRAVELNSIDCSALDTRQFCLGGGDEFVRVYDHRKPVGGASPVSVAQPIRRLAPPHLSLRGRAPHQVNITCAVFSCSGEVLASYNDDDVYLFAGEREAAAGGGSPAAPAQQMQRPGAARRGKRGRGSSASDGGLSEARRSRRPGGRADAGDVDASPRSSAGLSAGSGAGGSLPGLEDSDASPPGGSSSEEQGRSSDSEVHSSDADAGESDAEAGGRGLGGVDDIDEDHDGLPSRRRGSDGEEAGGPWRPGSRSRGGGAVLQRYEGHRNAATVKGVDFMGLGDQFVVSGSDCGHVYIWDKKGGELLTSFKADSQIVNVVQPHPSQPLTLATSGLEDSVRVWTPSAAEAEPPGLEELERMQRNKAGQGRPRSPHVMFSLEEMQMLLGQHLGGWGRLGSGDDSDFAGGGYGSSDDGEGGGGGPPEQCTLM